MMDQINAVVMLESRLIGVEPELPNMLIREAIPNPIDMLIRESIPESILPSTRQIHQPLPPGASRVLPEG